MKKDTKEKRMYYPYKSVIRGKNSINGITLVALVVTIVVLLILAGITITYIIGEDSVFNKAQRAKLEYEMAKAREKLEITFGHAQILKHTEPKYNQDDYLDDLMKKEIPNIKIKDNIVIVDGFAFEIDRSVPKIGQYLGKEEDLIFPEITANVTIADDNATATIHITAKEETNGISKIEVIQEGNVIKTYTYENEKGQIRENCVVKQNGIYTIRVYAKLTNKETVNVDGIMMSIEYTPNGNEEYKKEHQVKVTAKENDDKVKNMKYQWLDTTVEPEKDTFTESCTNGATLTKNGVTGSYYLWILLETEKGKTRIERSEAFNFDNQGPTVNLTSTPISDTSFKLNATATDNYSGITKYEFYVNESLVDTQETDANSANYTVTGVNMGSTNCYVIVTDGLGNETRKSVIAKTKLHTWRIYRVISTTVWETDSKTYTKHFSWTSSTTYNFTGWNSYTFNRQTGSFSGSGGCAKALVSISQYGVVCSACGKYEVSASKACKYASMSNHNGNKWSGSGDWSIIEYTGKRTTTYTKGEATGSNVSSPNPNAHPSDGVSGSYWYVYVGIQ